MVFSSPAWVPPIPSEIPDAVPVSSFSLRGKDDDVGQDDSRALLVDGLSGKTFSRAVLRDRVEWLAQALAQRLAWSPNEGSPWDKVVAIHSLNSVGLPQQTTCPSWASSLPIDYFVVCWAVHRLNGIVLPLHSTSTTAELTAHLESAKCSTVFTCQPLLPAALDAATQLSIPQSSIFTVSLPQGLVAGYSSPFLDTETLITEGASLPPLNPLLWTDGQAKDQVAYLCATSGTSGKQKLAMLTHYGLIVNAVQLGAFEAPRREPGKADVVTGVVPFSHGYGIGLTHIMVWRGDTMVVFPRFDMQLMLQSVQQHRINRLYIVPPILVAMVSNPVLFDMFDLSSITTIVSGSAPLDKSLADRVHSLQPQWRILGAYGLTESVLVATFTSPGDCLAGSSGSLVPGFQARLVGPAGEEIEALDTPGEILLMSPTLFRGYLGNDAATEGAFDAAGWLRTGDVGLFTRAEPSGHQHLFVLDRIKDMIKVKGSQVVPGDIETALRAHPAVDDVAVIGVPDETAGERPMAFVVRSKLGMADADAEDLVDCLDEYVQDRMDETHWLHDRIQFVEALPKSANGKVLRRVLRERAGTGTAW
ncbi:acetyl-CoA synthetase-like protein [Parathielavia hyrcaniae]|uniref:Acetyl-CoA synthetase-like protein n=1 Tax=Parathielavia hyrcaniae TaxID=113614 RepID=A0AAN6QBA6_9PEZI|nr:acetyl-CoA synthetase-like protein [Parathielavia hyrcaniae]